MALAERTSPEVAPIRLVQGAPAGVVSRCCAAAVDLAVVVVACVASYLLLSGVLFLWRPGSFSFPHVSRVVVAGFVVVVFVGYLTRAWTLAGRTAGNVLMGLRVVRLGHRRVGVFRAVVRALLYAAFPIGLLLCAVGRRRASLQDLVVRTAVVYDWSDSVPAPLAPEVPRGG